MKPAFLVIPGTLRGQPVFWLKQTGGRRVIPNPIAFGQAPEHAESYAAFISDGFGCVVTARNADGTVATREHEPHGPTAGMVA